MGVVAVAGAGAGLGVVAGVGKITKMMIYGLVWVGIQEWLFRGHFTAIFYFTS